MQQTEGRKRNILVCLSASPTNPRVIRAASRMYREGTDSFTALYVGSLPQETGKSTRLQENIRFAKECGAEVSVLESNEIAGAISGYAKSIGATDLFIGYSAPSHTLQSRTITERIIAYLPEVDIHIIPDALSSAYPQANRQADPPPRSLRDPLLVLLIMAAATGLSFLFWHSPFSNANIITIYILAVLVSSVVTSHQAYGVMAGILYVLLFNFLFIEPRFTLLVYDSSYLVTYCVSVLAALITGTLAVRLKNIAQRAAENEYQAKILLDTSNQLERAGDRDEIIRIACGQLSELLKRNVIFCGTEETEEDPQARVRIFDAEGPAALRLPEEELRAVLWTRENRQDAGAFTLRFPECGRQYLSVHSGTVHYGVVGVTMQGKAFTEFERTILLSGLNELTLALDKERIDREKKEAEIRADKERFRAGLLRSVSHDLRTPLTSIYGNACSLAADGELLDGEDRRRLCEDIREDASWLASQMENILSMTRLESNPKLNLTTESVADVIEESLQHLDSHSNTHEIHAEPVSEDLFAEMDARLIVLVIVNLVNNAIRHTPPGTRVDIGADAEDGLVRIWVRDDGEGVPDEDKKHIFELYYKGDRGPASGSRGTGVGLNLCEMILRAHGQRIEVLDNVPRGSIFRFYLKGKELHIDE